MKRMTKLIIAGTALIGAGVAGYLFIKKMNELAKMSADVDYVDDNDIAEIGKTIREINRSASDEVFDKKMKDFDEFNNMPVDDVSDEAKEFADKLKVFNGEGIVSPDEGAAELAEQAKAFNGEGAGTADMQAHHITDEDVLIHAGFPSGRFKLTEADSEN